MSITQGSALPDITTTTSADVPSWYTNTVTDASKIAQDQMKKTAATGLAAQDPLQLQGYAATPGAASSYIPGITAATQTAGQAGSAMNPAGIQQFMNPYINNVTNEQARLANQNWQRNVLPTLGGQFVGTGGYGGQRFANALGQAGADFQSNLTGQQNKSLADAYASALTGSYNQGQLQNAVAQTQGTLAGKEQELGLKGASALTAAGAAQQAYEQSKLDYPITNAQNAMKVLSGLTIPQGKTVVGPGTQGQYQNSTLQNLAGLSTLIGSAGAGKVGDFLFGKAASGNAAAVPGILSKILGGGTQSVVGSELIGAGADGKALYYSPSTGSYYNSSGKTVGVNWGLDDTTMTGVTTGHQGATDSGDFSAVYDADGNRIV
jgi:hypothetical protein